MVRFELSRGCPVDASKSKAKQIEINAFWFYLIPSPLIKSVSWADSLMSFLDQNSEIHGIGQIPWDFVHLTYFTVEKSTIRHVVVSANTIVKFFYPV